MARRITRAATTREAYGDASDAPFKKTNNAKKATTRKPVIANETLTTLQTSNKASTPTNSTRKRKRAVAPKLEDDPDQLPHGLGELGEPSDAEAKATEAATKQETPAEVDTKPEAAFTPPADSIEASAAAPTAATVISPAQDLSAKKPRKKAHPYGLTPGVTPFPDWPHPTPEECQEVNDLLSTIHGNIKPPEKIPEPSLTFAGCGEVPCVLDALIRTYLSAATSGNNSSNAFKGLLEEYGQQTTGVGKGSVNWDAVRRSDVSRVFNAIRSGGLAAVKSKNIKKILDMVYEENQSHRDALLVASSSSSSSSSKEEANKENANATTTTLPKDAAAAAANETRPAQILEIARANRDILSLDHLHAMSRDDAFAHMLRYPGVGVKTASCVTLFCLRRPSFAVDTHVFRLCRWLGWVPENATRDSTFNHCEGKKRKLVGKEEEEEDSDEDVDIEDASDFEERPRRAKAPHPKNKKTPRKVGNKAVRKR
ncbi:MAG: hypothetical protein Q9219_003720 [cf. Caloplaca sp. 3 TL-2023]